MKCSSAIASVVLIAGLLAPGLAQAATSFVYIGSFTPDPADQTMKAANHGEGIYLADVDLATGVLSHPRLAAKALSPTWMVLSADHKFLYSVNEFETYNGTTSGTVSAYDVDATTGALRLLNTVSTQAAIPTYISLHPSGKFALVADHVGGAYTVLPIKPDGSLGEATDVVRLTGPQMPSISTDSPPGNFVRSDHRGPRGHMILTDPSGKFLVADDAGLDRIMTYRFDTVSGKLALVTYHQSLPGSAPRHFVYGSGGRLVYQIQEQDSMLSVYDFDQVTGTLSLKQKLSALPPGFAGTSATSEILMSRDQHHLYVANRINDSITTFDIGADGVVRWRAIEPTLGDWPRSLTLDPSGRFLYSLNQRGDNVTQYRIDAKTGQPHFTGKFLPIPSAAMMVFLAR